MSDSQSPSEGPGAPAAQSLADRPGYREAFARATSSNHAVRQLGLNDLEIIASGGQVRPPGAVAPPSHTSPLGHTPGSFVGGEGLAGDTAYQEAYTRTSGLPVGAARDAARAAMADAALAHETAHPASGAATGAPPVGYEAAQSLSEYKDPGVPVVDPEAFAGAKAAMLELGVPAMVGSLALREFASHAHLFTDQASYDRGMSDASKALTRSLGPKEAATTLQDAHRMIVRLPEGQRYQAGFLLCSPLATQQLAQLHRLNVLKAP